MPDGKYDRSVSLGCGTLILIALIVILFSGLGTTKLESEIRGMRRELGSLTTKIESQSDELRAIREEVKALKVGLGAAAVGVPPP